MESYKHENKNKIKKQAECIWLYFPKWPLQYLPSHELFLDCDFDTLPIKKWSLCLCLLKLGRLCGCFEQ